MDGTYGIAQEFSSYKHFYWGRGLFLVYNYIN